MDASIGIKIIENHSIADKKFLYNFNGTRVFDKKQLQVLKENKELQEQSDMYEAAIEPFMLERGSIPETPMSSEELAASYGHGLPPSN
jgi:hypothetical protein